MPELPEVEIVRRNVDRWWTGKTTVGAELLDDTLLMTEPPSGAEEMSLESDLDAIVGHELERAVRHSKMLVLEHAGGAVLGVHFRMTGKLVRAPRGDAEDDDAPDSGSNDGDGGYDHGDGAVEFGRARFDVEGLEDAVWFKDPRRLGELFVTDRDGLDTYLDSRGWGPEPWPEPLAHAVVCERLSKTRRKLADALRDPHIIAGMGNIAASEVLWRARIDPTTKANAADDEQCERIAEAIHAHLQHVLDTEDAPEVTYIAEDASANPFCVYRRAGAPCPRCDAEIAKGKIGQRTTFWCPRCQQLAAPA